MFLKKKNNITIFFFCILLGWVALYVNHLPAADDFVYSIQLNDDTINPVTGEYITKAIDRAQKDGAKAVIINLDTPGGLLNTTRLIVKKMLTAKVPVIVYISPSGSRAGSAGVFITYASHVAAMAPSTNIGAAHPVQMGGNAPKESEDWKELKELIEELREVKKKNEKSENGNTNIKEDKKSKEDGNKKSKEESVAPDEHPMESKILNDTVAFIKAIASERNRNVEWAVLSVTQSESITEKEALEKGVIEYVADTEQDLLIQIDGKVVRVDGQDVVLDTKHASIRKILMSFTQKFFNVLANPNIAYFLMILGFYGLLYEVTHPGIGVPGVLGTIFLILAFYSLQTLPTNYAGLALLVLGLLLLIAEAYVPGFGLLFLGGVVCIILGSMLLFDAPDPVMRVSRVSIYAFAIPMGLLSLLFLRFLIKSRNKPVVSGREGLINQKAVVHQKIVPGKAGKVFIHGEIWTAKADQEIQKDDEVVVVKSDGLVLTVKKL